ncbi:MAG: PEP-CTERM sorting domain-containing protein [Planctomycetota bacterium]|jgi:hypothetical protein
MIKVQLFIATGLCVFLLTGVGSSAALTDGDFVPLIRASSYGTGSGLGTLDLVLFCGATSDNSIFDAANTTMPGVTSSADAYYITAFGDIRSYYDQQFGAEIIDEIMLFVDLNESVAGDVSFDLLDIIVNNSDIYGDNRDYPSTTDISSAEQALTSAVTGGSLIVEYATDSSFTNLKPTIENGSGWADYGVLTGINPYAKDGGGSYIYGDDTRIAFHVQFSGITNGAEELFFSGEYSAADIIKEEVPEPVTFLLFGLGGVGLLRKRRVKA